MYADRTCAMRRAVNKRDWELVWCMEQDAHATCIEANRRFSTLTRGADTIEALRASVLVDMNRQEKAE